MVPCFVRRESEPTVERSYDLYDNVSRGFFLNRIIDGVGSDGARMVWAGSYLDLNDDTQLFVFEIQLLLL